MMNKAMQKSKAVRNSACKPGSFQMNKKCVQGNSPTLDAYPRVWRVSWNKKLYNTNSLSIGSLVPQSKGRARIRVVPVEGDRVWIACGGYAIAEGEVVEGFQEGTSHQTDPNNRGGEDAEHRTVEIYAKIKITNMPQNPNPLRGVQRTWSRYPA